MDRASQDPEVLKAKINQETAKIPWQELQRFFAQGRVIFVDAELDLVEVAAVAAADRAQDLASWVSAGAISKVTDHQARLWLESDALLWTAVVKPWVLVQEPRTIKAEEPDHRQFDHQERSS